MRPDQQGTLHSLRIRLGIVAVLCLLPLQLWGAKVRVSDEAALLHSGEESQLQIMLEDYSQRYATDLFVLTRKSLGGVDTRSYAEQFFYGNQHGAEGGTGAVLLIDMGGRDMGIYTFGKAIAQFESRVDGILDRVAPKLTAQQYYDACLAFVLAMRPIKFSEALVQTITSVWPWVVSAIFALILVLILSRDHRGKHIVTGKTYQVDKSFTLFSKEDAYTHTTTTRTKIQSSSSSGGGGGSRSSGGGSRKF